MTPEEREKRKRIMQRSIRLGHCVCDPKKPCPCPVFKEKNICECAGERLPVQEGPVRLTECVRGAGCASKIGRRELREALSSLPPILDQRVLVGSSSGDDAGVIRLGPGEDSILTVDVFAPAVDDPYLFGQIAAANSVSDIYAMGGIPQAALSIIGFPIHSLPALAMQEILRGGADKMAEAGVPVVGGHSINDEEVKCGFAVLGTCRPGEYITNQGARPGDRIILTKPLGNGIIAFAGQIGRADVDSLSAAADSMKALNRVAGEGLHRYSCHAATDVTGYSLLGHLSEIVRQSDVRVELVFDQIPVFPGVRELCIQEVLPGAVERNREAVDPALIDVTGISSAQEAVLYSPETSGGLVAFFPPDQAEGYLAYLRENGVRDAAMIGTVAGEHPGGLLCVTSHGTEMWRSESFFSASVKNEDVSFVKKEESVSCCSGSGKAPEPPILVTKKSVGCCSKSSFPEEKPALLPPLPAESAAAWKVYQQAIHACGALAEKEKNLIGLALSVLTRCEPCVKIHARTARQSGATPEEIAEAAAMAVSFGGASVSMFYNQLRETVKGDCPEQK